MEGSTPVHRCDARVKIGALFVYSIAVLAVNDWIALGALVIALAVVLVMAKFPPGLLCRSLIPIYPLAAFSLLCNIIYVPTLDGASTGLFMAVRMIALVAASFAVCFTTTSTELLGAFRSIIGPFRHLRVPVDDVAFTLALSVRFIPVIEAELESIRTAQKARGAEAFGSLSRKLRVWGQAFTTLFVNLFRHADNLATAMDARCYGAASQRGNLHR